MSKEKFVDKPVSSLPIFTSNIPKNIPYRDLSQRTSNKQTNSTSLFPVNKFQPRDEFSKPPASVSRFSIQTASINSLQAGDITSYKTCVETLGEVPEVAAKFPDLHKHFLRKVLVRTRYAVPDPESGGVRKRIDEETGAIVDDPDSVVLFKESTEQAPLFGDFLLRDAEITVVSMTSAEIAQKGLTFIRE